MAHQNGQNPRRIRMWTAEEAARIPGNCPPEVKQRIANVATGMGQSVPEVSFGKDIGERLELTDISVNKNMDETTKAEARVVCEIEVTQDMLNWGLTMHGGCIAFLIDICTSLPTLAFDTRGGYPLGLGVSQALNIVFHGPAEMGDTLRIVSTTISLGSRVRTIRCEVWNVKCHRLVATGVHVKMTPSAPKL